MKKKYQKPEMQAVEVEVENVIAASIDFGSDYEGTEGVEAGPRGGLLDSDKWSF